MTETTDHTEKVVSFGVGCFRFTYWDERGAVVTSAQILTAVQKALEGLPAINNVDIEPSIVRNEITIEGPRPALYEGEGVVSPKAFTIDFDVYIPRRVQENIVGKIFTEGPSREGTEHFRVHLRDTFHGEVAFVVPLGEALDDVRPSDSVQIVREFLVENFKDPSGNVRFEALGPSPMHADFYVSMGSVTGRRAFLLEYKKRRGYDELRFTANSHVFDSIGEAIAELFYEIAPDAGSLYEITRLRSAAIREWVSLSEQIDALLRDDPGHPKRPKLEPLMKALARFELAQVFREDEIKDIDRDLDESDNSYIRDILKGEIDGFEKYPTEQIGRVLSFQWSRRETRLG